MLFGSKKMFPGKTEDDLVNWVPFADIDQIVDMPQNGIFFDYWQCRQISNSNKTFDAQAPIGMTLNQFKKAQGKLIGTNYQQFAEIVAPTAQ